MAPAPDPTVGSPGDLLPPLREVIRRHGLAAKKSLGQHFLLDLNLTARIARAAGPLGGVHVVEVGPGPGGLTRALLATEAARVVAIERDPRCLAALAEIADAYPGRLTVVEGDALALDERTLVPPPRRIVANLPYNIAAPLLIGWLKRIDDFERIVVMVQKEMADRLVAKPGGKDYGRLSVAAQWAAVPRIEFNVDRLAFVPPPKVTSSVVSLTPRATREPAGWDALETVTRFAFGQRRKMLRQSLKPLGLDLAALGLLPTARAEDLTVAEFCRLAERLAARSDPA